MTTIPDRRTLWWDLLLSKQSIRPMKRDCRSFKPCDSTRDTARTLRGCLSCSLGHSVGITLRGEEGDLPPVYNNKMRSLSSIRKQEGRTLVDRRQMFPWDSLILSRRSAPPCSRGPRLLPSKKTLLKCSLCVSFSYQRKTTCY